MGLLQGLVWLLRLTSCQALTGCTSRWTCIFHFDNSRGESPRAACSLEVLLHEDGHLVVLTVVPSVTVGFRPLAIFGRCCATDYSV